MNYRDRQDDWTSLEVQRRRTFLHPSCEVVHRWTTPTHQDPAGSLACRVKKSHPVKAGSKECQLRRYLLTYTDRGLGVVPTREWQDNLSNRLVSGSGSGSRSFDGSGVPLPQRRRLNASSRSFPSSPDWNEMYTMENSGTVFWRYISTTRF
jgi:hypothetical protein